MFLFIYFQLSIKLLKCFYFYAFIIKNLGKLNRNRNMQFIMQYFFIDKDKIEI